jgi:hypothetical protein
MKKNPGRCGHEDHPPVNEEKRNQYDENDSAKGVFLAWRIRESMLSSNFNLKKHTMPPEFVKEFSPVRAKILPFQRQKMTALPEDFIRECVY